MRASIYDMSPYSHLAMTGRNISVGIIGVSDGTYIQPEERVDKLISNDLELLGLYHYLRSEKTLQDQIKTFDKAIDPYTWSFLACDFEMIHNEHLNGKFGLMARDFIAEFIEAYKKPVLLYTSPRVVQEWLLPFGQTWQQSVDLWIAQWPYNERFYGPQSVLKEVPNLTDKWNPRLPAGCVNWKVWQYSADGNKRASEFGASGNSSIDLSVFNGTMEEMKAWCKPASVPEPPVPPDCSEVREQTINECINALKEL